MSNPLLLLTQFVEIVTDLCVTRQLTYLREQREKSKWGHFKYTYRIRKHYS